MDLTFTDERVDLVSEGVDVAVWLANPRGLQPGRAPSHLHQQCRGRQPWVFREAGMPNTPHDLTQHNCIVFTDSIYSSNGWRFAKDGETIDVPVSGNLRTATGSTLLDLVCNGMGVTFIQHWMARRAVQEGGLVRVLADYDPNPVELAIPLCVVYPHSHGLPPKTRAFVDFLVSVFKEIEADTLETHSCRPHHGHPARG